MRHSRSFNMHPLTVVFAMLVITTAETATCGDKPDKPFEVKQQRDLSALESKLKAKAGAKPEDTWYVLAFCDEARQAEFVPPTRPGYYSGYWSFDVECDVKYQIVKGRKAAAEAIYRFLMQSSASANKLRPTVFNNVSGWQKNWRFRAFASQKAAQALYDYHKTPDQSTGSFFQ